MDDLAWTGQVIENGEITVNPEWFRPYCKLVQVPDIEIKDTRSQFPLYQGSAMAHQANRNPFPAGHVQGVQTFDEIEGLTTEFPRSDRGVGCCFVPGRTSVASQDTAGGKS